MLMRLAAVWRWCVRASAGAEALVWRQSPSWAARQLCGPIMSLLGPSNEPRSNCAMPEREWRDGGSGGRVKHCFEVLHACTATMPPNNLPEAPRGLKSISVPIQEASHDDEGAWMRAPRRRLPWRGTQRQPCGL